MNCWPYTDRTLRELLIQRRYLHADETTVQVQHETGRASETKSYIWLYHSGGDGPPIALYDDQQTRSAEHPRRFLAGFTGYLHVDGYAEYNDIPNVKLVGCWAHARRKFDEALKAPAGEREKPVAARVGLENCNRLFALERKFKNAMPEQWYEARLTHSKSVLDRLWPTFRATLARADWKRVWDRGNPRRWSAKCKLK